MRKLMGRPRLLTKGSLNSLSVKLRKTLGGGIQCLMKPCGHIGWRVMVQLKCRLISWYIETMQYYLGELKLALGGYSQDHLTADDYDILMKDELEDLAGHRLKALVSIEENKKRMAR